jgi:hypothetical protein
MKRKILSLLFILLSWNKAVYCSEIHDDLTRNERTLSRGKIPSSSQGIKKEPRNISLSLQSEAFWEDIRRQEESEKLQEQRTVRNELVPDKIQSGRTIGQPLDSDRPYYLMSLIKKISPQGRIDPKQLQNSEFLDNVEEWWMKSQSLKAELSGAISQKRRVLLQARETTQELSEHVKHKLPAKLYLSLPTRLIMDMKFDPLDSPLDHSRKLINLGFAIQNSFILGVKQEDRETFIAYCFALAAYNHIKAASSSTIAERPDLYLSAGQLFIWAAYHFPSHKAAISNLHRGQQALDYASFHLEAVPDEQRKILSQKIKSESEKSKHYERVRTMASTFQDILMVLNLAYALSVK